MPKEGIYIETPEGKEFVYYDELDAEVLPQILKPIGGFCYQADDFVSLPLTSAPFYLKDWLPKQGKMEIYAPPKSGKSYMMLQLARCVGSGKPFLGMATNLGKVLYLQFELGEEVLQDRLKQTGQTYNNVYVGTTFSMKLDSTTQLKRVYTALDAIRPDVLIIDPFYKAIKGDENEAKDMREVLDNLDEIIGAWKCSIVIIHHPGKDISKGGRGSSVLEDWVDSCIEMKKLSKPGEPLRVKLTPKLLRHAELPSEPIEAEMQRFEFKRTDAEPTIKQVMEKAFRLTSSDIIAVSSLSNLGSRKSIYNALEDLIREGKVERVSRGGYKYVGGG